MRSLRPSCSWASLACSFLVERTASHQERIHAFLCTLNEMYCSPFVSICSPHKHWLLNAVWFTVHICARTSSIIRPYLEDMSTKKSCCEHKFCFLHSSLWYCHLVLENQTSLHVVTSYGASSMVHNWISVWLRRCFWEVSVLLFVLLLYQAMTEFLPFLITDLRLVKKFSHKKNLTFAHVFCPLVLHRFRLGHRVGCNNSSLVFLATWN